MKTTLKFIIAAIAFLSFYSCEKNFENSLDPIIPHDSLTLLSKLIFINTNVSDTDTIAYKTFTYDARQRVAAINLYSYQSGLPVLDTVAAFYYSGTASTPYQKIITNTDTANSFSDTAFYFYDASQRLIKDSVISALSVEVGNYSYSDTTIKSIRRLVYKAMPLDTNNYSDSSVIESSWNIVQMFTSSYDKMSYKTNFTYDSTTNPFYQLNIHIIYKPMAGFNFNIYDGYLQKNNVTGLTEENLSAPGNTLKATYSYTYNALGLPGTINISYENNPAKKLRLVFMYAKI